MIFLLFYVNILLIQGDVMEFETINKLIKEKEQDIKDAKKHKLFFCLPLGIMTATFIAMACVFNPLWTINVAVAGLSYLFSEIVYINGIKLHKKKLKELLDKKNSFDEENKKITTYEDTKEVNTISKTKKSIISTKIENIESKEDDLTI